jgi:hypothetical protein
MTNETDKDRDEFLVKGSKVLESELIQAVNYSTSLQNHLDIELKNVDVLSTSILANKNLNENIKKQIRDYSDNLQKILLATTDFIEEKSFTSVEEAVSSLDLSKYDKNRISTLITAQKKISFSFQTLNVAIELFSRVNESLLEKIKESNNNFESIKLRLQNAILVYELTQFISNFINEFGLVGIEDIEYIREDVFQDIERLNVADQNLLSTLKNVRKETVDMISDDIKNREIGRTLVKKKWEEFNSRIKSIQEGIGSVKAFIPDLKAIRDNAKNQIEFLQIIATIQVLQSNLEIIKNISYIKKLAIAPLTTEDACNLLGIDIQQAKLIDNPTK